MNKPRIEPVADGAARPFWSIVIPIHNPDPHQLRETLHSVRDAHLDPDRAEIIVIANMKEAIDLAPYMTDWTAPIPIFIHKPVPLGVANSWNSGIQKARGDWIHVLHQDDRIKPGFYEAMEEGIRQAPTCGMAISNIEFIDAESQHLRDGYCTQKESGVLDNWVENIVINLVIQCPGAVVRRAVYERLGGFNPVYRYCADYEMWHRIASEYPVWYDPRPLACYRAHAASTTHRDFTMRERWLERRRALRDGVARCSPVIRDTVSKHGRFYLTKAAWHDCVDAWRAAKGTPHRQLAALVTFLLSFSPTEIQRMRKFRWMPPVESRAPARGLDPSKPRRPRILTLSESFPGVGEWAERGVTGAFQRALRNLRAVSVCGCCDAVYFWPPNHPFQPHEVDWIRQRLKPEWNPEGALRFIAPSQAPEADFPARPWSTLYWCARGVASCYRMHPTQYSCGFRQTEILRDILMRLQPDLCFAYRAGTLNALRRTRLKMPPVIVDIDDVDHVRISRFYEPGNGWRAALRHRLEVLFTKYMAWHSARAATFVTISSEADRRATPQIGMKPRDIRILPNTAHSPDTPPVDSSERALLFVGYAAYKPNQDAIRWLTRDIWPRVKAAVPDATLHIVGERALEFAAHDPANGLHVWDFVPDLAPHYARAAVAVCPIQSGSGTRIKIIEAAMYQRAIVSATIGAEGLKFAPGQEIIIADTTETFATACIDLLNNTDQRVSLARAARAKAMALYSEAANERQLTEWIQAYLPR